MRVISRMLAVVVPLLLGSLNAKTLDTLDIEGLRIQQRAMVEGSVGLYRGVEVSPLEIQVAIKKLSRLGFFRTVDFFSFDETDSTVSLLLKLEEYPICESIEYNGFKKIKPKDKEIADKMTLSKDLVISDPALHENITILKNAYADKGYLLADISADLVETKIPGRVIVKFIAKEGTKVRIKQITFSGNTAFDATKLKRKFKTKENKWFTAGEFKRDEYTRNLDSLIIFYQDKGYLDAAVAKDSVWYSENKKDIFVSIQLEEGRKYYVGDFFFTGNKILAKEDLLAHIAMKRAKPFQKSKFDLTKGMIGNAYREEGYLWVQLREQYQYRGDTIDVVLDVTEGKPAIVRKVDVEGNNKTFEKVVRRELRLFPGQKYKQSRMERSIRDVMALNYFDNVTPDLRPNDDGTIDLAIKVKEKENIGQFSAGVVYSQLEGFGGNFSIAIPNFRGRGQELSAKLDFLRYRQNFSIDFQEPWFKDNPVSVSGGVFYSRFQYQYGPRDVITSGGFRVGAGRRLKWPDDYFRFDAQYQLSREQETPYTLPVQKFDLVEKGLLSKWTLTLRRNDTDIPNFPTRGSIFQISTDIAGLGGLGLQDTVHAFNTPMLFHNYIKGSVKYDWFFPLFWKFVLGSKSEIGLLGGAGGNKPRVSRYDVLTAGGVYYGGQLRGYTEESFGGRYHPDDGAALLTFSTELRFPILEQQLYLGVFYDMGNTWGSIRDIDVMDMYKGVGAGVRLLFPMIGLLGFDFGWNLDDPKTAHFDGVVDGKPEFHFLMNRGF
jgi:outer membrane protein insertion porin family